MTTYTSGVERGGQECLGVWTVTDWTEDLTLDCDSDDANLGDTLGTLIKQLIQKGILKGSVVTK